MVPSSQTGAGAQLPAALQISFAPHGSPQHTLAPLAFATHAPLLHSAPALQGASRSFFGREQLPSASQSAVGLHSTSACQGSKAVHA